jgi:hypothetical protein
MAHSSYQVQRLMERLQRARAGDAAAAPPQEAGGLEVDRVRLSERARAQAAAVAGMLRLPAGTPVSPATIVDDAPLPAAIRIELERRAGSFMRPPLPPSERIVIPRARRARPEPEGE